MVWWPFSHFSTPTNPGASKCPVEHETRGVYEKYANVQPQDGETGQCPINHETQVAFLEQAKKQSTTPDETTRDKNLSQEREVSSIPRYYMDLETTNSEMPSVHSGSETAVDEQERNWVYPSPSQFYTAVTRKNHDVRAEDMNVVVPIHNAVNEEAWRRILEWERSWKAQGSTAPHLVNFVGRPKDLTWRAWFRSLAGYQPPFDRHDWVIARPNPDSDAPRMMRYIIDFYAGRPSANAEIDTKNTMMRAQDPKNAVAFYLDVRPAPDSAEGIAMRLHQIWRSFSPS